MPKWSPILRTLYGRIKSVCHWNTESRKKRLIYELTERNANDSSSHLANRPVSQSIRQFIKTANWAIVIKSRSSSSISALSSQVTCVSHYNNQSRKYCGVKTMLMTLNYSECDSLELSFVSNYLVTHGGFQIQYTVTPVGKWPVYFLHESLLFVISPSLHPPNKSILSIHYPVHPFVSNHSSIQNQFIWPTWWVLWDLGPTPLNS